VPRSPLLTIDVPEVLRCKLFLYLSFSYDSLALTEQALANLGVCVGDRFHAAKLKTRRQACQYYYDCLHAFKLVGCCATYRGCKAMIYKRGCDKKGPEETCSRCGERRACGVYWFKFLWQGKLIRESTHQGNDKVARCMESAQRTKLAQEHKDRKDAADFLDCRPDQLVPCANCRDWLNSNFAFVVEEKKFCSSSCRTEWANKHRNVPNLASFLKERILPWAKNEFFGTRPKNVKWYRNEIRVLSEYEPLANSALDAITGESVSKFAAWRIGQGRQVATVNSSIRVLRRALNLAVEWGLIAAAPKLQVLTGERRRERVITTEEEARYLLVASEPLASIATVLADTGMRPEECFRLQWEHVFWLNGRNGMMLVTHGKTESARRLLPMTLRVRAILEKRWCASGRAEEGWVWTAGTRSGHVEPNSIYGQHLKAIQSSKVRPFVLYSLRHTFLTRLGESGCDAWTLARIAGHSSVAISLRYVHPSEDKVLDAISRLGGHKIGHSEQERVLDENGKLLPSSVT
jgi:integrase